MTTQAPDGPAVTINTNQDLQLTLNPTAPDGSASKYYNTPAFKVLGTGTATPLGQLTTPTDGSLPKYVTNGAEAVTLVVDMDADPTPGANVVQQSFMLTVVAPSVEASNPGFSGTPVAKAAA